MAYYSTFHIVPDSCLLADFAFNKFLVFNVTTYFSETGISFAKFFMAAANGVLLFHLPFLPIVP